MSSAVSYSHIEAVRMLVTAATLDDWDEFRVIAGMVATSSPAVIVNVLEAVTAMLASYFVMSAEDAGHDVQESLLGMLDCYQRIAVPGAV